VVLHRPPRPDELRCGREPRMPRSYRGRAYQQMRGPQYGAQAGAKRSFSPSLRNAEKNHSADAPVPAATSATVAAVESIRNILAGSATISTARPAVSSRRFCPQPGRALEEAVQARVMAGRLP
jgi:hypothetical protein